MKRLEDFIQYKCAQWLRDNRIVFCHVPNASRRGPREGARLKAMGMVAGVHDILLFFENGLLVLVELKTDDGALSTAQERWHADMTRMGFHHHILQTDSADIAVAQLADLVAHYQAVAKNHNQ